MLNALEVVTTVVVGLMVGVEFSVAFVINPILTALPGDNGLRGRIHGARLLGAVMPFWYIGSLVLAALWGIAGRDDRGAGLVVIAAALLVLSVVMSILLLVPINNRVKAWTADGSPADGLPADGLPADGLPADGLPADGLPADGLPADGLTADGLPADWKQQMNRWDRFHYVRIAVIVSAFTLLVTALA